MMDFGSDYITPNELGEEILEEMDEITMFAESIIDRVEEDLENSGADAREKEFLENIKNIMHNLRANEQVILGGMNVLSDLSSNQIVPDYNMEGFDSFDN
jgi:hypothetical protein